MKLRVCILTYWGETSATEYIREALARRNLVVLLRQGASHEIWWNRKAQLRAAVPRHRDIPLGTARRISRDLQIPDP